MEFVLLWITSIASFNASFIHIPFLIFGGTQFSCGVDLLFCRGKIFLVSSKVCCLQIQHVPSPRRDYQVDCLYLPSPSLYQLGGVHCSPTKVMPFSSLKTT
jgi:hypothetical protein